MLNKMATPARAAQTSEEKYVKVGTTWCIYVTLTLNDVKSLALNGVKFYVTDRPP